MQNAECRLALFSEGRKPDDIKFLLLTSLNFDDEFAEPIIKFVLVSDIQNLRIDLGNCLIVSKDKIVVLRLPLNSDQTRTAHDVFIRVFCGIQDAFLF